MNLLKYMTVLAACAFVAMGAAAALAETPQDYTLTIKDHKFTPETLEIPAGQKVKITIDNQDPTAEEFESYELNREKVIQGNSKGIVFVGPLKAGRYPFFGEFNASTAQGAIVVK